MYKFSYNHFFLSAIAKSINQNDGIVFKYQIMLELSFFIL